MSEKIYEFCHMCYGAIDVSSQEFWLLHGRQLSSKRRREFGMLCKHCVDELRLKNKKEKKDGRERSANALSDGDE